MNDETMLAERVGQLVAEKAQLVEQVEDLKSKLNAAERSAAWHKAQRYIPTAVTWFSLLLVGAAILAFFGKLISEPHVVDHCYVDRGGDGNIRLYGNVEWGRDDNYGPVESLERGIEQAKKVGCRVFPEKP